MLVILPEWGKACTLCPDRIQADCKPFCVDGCPADETHRALHRCLDRLDREVHEAIWLIYFEDMSYSEAATVMGVNQKKIDNLLARGKQVLKQELGKEGIHHAYE